MKFCDIKKKVKQHAGKVMAAVTGGAVMLGNTVTAFAADGAGEGVSAAKSLLESATAQINIGNIVAIIGAGIGAVLALYLGWWGARKLVRMLMAAFSKGKISV